MLDLGRIEWIFVVVILRFRLGRLMNNFKRVCEIQDVYNTRITCKAG